MQEQKPSHAVNPSQPASEQAAWRWRAPRKGDKRKPAVDEMTGVLEHPLFSQWL